MGVIPASAALPVDPLAIPPPSPVGLAPTPVAGGNFGEVPAAAPPEAVITDAPTADTAVANAPLDINLDGLSLNSVLNLGNLVQQTISLQTPAAAASPVAEFRRWADDAE